MAKNKDKKFINAAHIKRHTEGTSNEISFSVLDAAKNKADAEEGLDEKAQTPFGKITLWSLRPKKVKPGTPTRDDALALSSSAAASASAEATYGKNQANTMPSGMPTDLPKVLPNASTSAPPSFSSNLSQETEIERRKGKRRRSRVLYALIVTVIVAGLIGGGGYYLYTEIQKHQGKVSLLNQALSKIEESDKTIVSMDKAINDLSESDSTEIERILASLTEATTHLDEAEVMAQEAQQDMRDSVEKEAAEEAVEAAEARRDMITSGEPLLQAELAARSEEAAIQQAWASVLKGDELAREAAEIVTDTTNENVELSKQKTNEAITQFEEGLYQLNELASSSFFGLELQPAIDYVSKRLESMNHAIVSDDAILAQDRETAQSENDAYNATELEASLLAKDLPEDMATLVADAHEDYSAEYAEQYLSVRQAASTADAFLRDYLGT